MYTAAIKISITEHFLPILYCPRIQWDKEHLTPIQLVMIPTKAATHGTVAYSIGRSSAFAKWFVY
jgi:hypothetical protein